MAHLEEILDNLLRNDLDIRRWTMYARAGVAYPGNFMHVRSGDGQIRAEARDTLQECHRFTHVTFGAFHEFRDGLDDEGDARHS